MRKEIYAYRSVPRRQRSICSRFAWIRCAFRCAISIGRCGVLYRSEFQILYSRSGYEVSLTARVQAKPIREITSFDKSCIERQLRFHESSCIVLWTFQMRHGYKTNGTFLETLVNPLRLSVREYLMFLLFLKRIYNVISI